MSIALNAVKLNTCERSDVKFYKVLSNEINVREQPERNSKIIEKMKYGVIFTAYARIESENREENGKDLFWLLIKKGETFGWISSEHIIDVFEMKKNFKYYPPDQLLKTGCFIDGNRKTITEFVKNRWKISVYDSDKPECTWSFNIKSTGNNPYVLNIKEIQKCDIEYRTKEGDKAIETISRSEDYKTGISMEYNIFYQKYTSTGPGLFYAFLNYNDLNKPVKINGTALSFGDFIYEYDYSETYLKSE